MFGMMSPPAGESDVRKHYYYCACTVQYHFFTIINFFRVCSQPSFVCDCIYYVISMGYVVYHEIFFLSDCVVSPLNYGKKISC